MHPSRIRILRTGGLAAGALLAGICWRVEAGDILRGGSSGSAPATGGIAAGGTPAAAAAPGRAQDSLARTTQAIESVRTMQAAARALATNGPNNLGIDPNRPSQALPNVSNGLTLGGLQVAPGVPANLSNPAPGENAALWQGARLPVQTAAPDGRTNVNITQTTQQALLNWQTFNVGKNTTLTFDQSAGGARQTEWVAFNRISDPSGSPSQILGSIQAPGQVFVINQNGIIFGGTAQVNVHALLASSLPINDNLVSRGLLNNPDLQFLFSQLAIPVISGGSLPAFEPSAPLTASGRNGDVTVQAGAQLSSPTTADKVGGRIGLIGANVRNAGTISTPDGQTILAAGLQVGLSAHSSNDPTLRGLDVFIGVIDAFSGSATNTGFIDAPRASVTLAGSSVGQLGVVRSTTSVSLNGRIDLLADFGATRTRTPDGRLFLSPTQNGVVTLGSGSTTAILPELDSTDRVVGTQLALASIVNVQGQAIHLERGALLAAPGAAVPADSNKPALGVDGQSLGAGITLKAGTWAAAALSGPFQFTLSSGQVYLDAGAFVDAAGVIGVAASVTENIVAAQLRGSELADFPLQRDGPLRGQTVFIDIRQSGTYNGRTWIGTPLADVSGYAALVQRTVGELSSNGGTVNLAAGGSVVMQPGSHIDVSGGSIDYAGGLVQTTRVLSGGRVFDISQATPDRIYDGIYNGFTLANLRFGTSANFASSLVSGPQFQAGYTFGGNGGAVSISAPALALDGGFRGVTITGPRQVATPPAPGSLAVAVTRQSNVPDFLPIAPAVAPEISFRTASGLAPADAFALDTSGHPLPLRLDRQIQVVLSPDLVGSSGFGLLRIDNGEGNISVPAGVALDAAPGSSLLFAGANIEVLGRLSASAGNISLSTFTISPAEFRRLSLLSNQPTPPANPTRGVLRVGENAVLTTAGRMIDSRNEPNALPLELLLPGGTISAQGYRVAFESGSRVDVSGGFQVLANGRITYGKGGGITIAGGQDLNLGAVIGGSLALGAQLVGFSGNTGGSLSVLAPLVQVGGSNAPTGAFQVAPDFFTQGGFTRFTLSGLGQAVAGSNDYLPGILIAPGTVIHPTAQSTLVTLEAGTVDVSQILRPEGIRVPASVSFIAVGVLDVSRGADNAVVVRGDLVQAAGSRIETDARASVTMSGDTASIFGAVIAPGGEITVRGVSRSLIYFTDRTNALPTVFLGPASLLSAAGTTLLTPDPLGFRTGTVLAGGRVSLSGNIVGAAGSRIDVTGAAGVLDLVPGAAGVTQTDSASTNQRIATRVESNGGSVTLAGGQELFYDGTISGAAGGPTAQGGSLAVSSSRFTLSPEPFTPLDTNLVVTQSGPVIGQPFGRSAIGLPVRNADGSAALAIGHFAVDRFVNRGFDALTLAGSVQFVGRVSISANGSIVAGTAGVIFADAGVSLEAPYIRLGTAFQPPLTSAQQQAQVSAFLVGGAPFYFSPVNGPGRVSVTGQLIDVGNLSLQNIGELSLNATGGDIRGDGTLDVAGNISLTAGQIYPPTGVSFTVAAFDYTRGGAAFAGSVFVGGGGARDLPLSAGGQLNIYASFIEQSGVLRAPLGDINLGRSLTGSSGLDLISNKVFPVSTQLTATTGSVTSVSALDPITGKGLIVPYGTVLNGISWLDPAGNDITVDALPAKAVNLSANDLAVQAGAVIDVAGGGDLFAYRFVRGNGGSTDLLGLSTSFAVIPGSQAGFAPFDPSYGTSPAVGERIHLSGINGLPAGDYTVLPARYALLAGAFLVTPRIGAPDAAAPQADGSTVVSGYRFNALNGTARGGNLFTSFQVLPAAVVRTRAQYDTFSANTFFANVAKAREIAPQRLPQDAGQVVLAAQSTLTLQGTLRAQVPAGGIGGTVDIASPADIFVASGGRQGPAGSLTLDAATLTAFGADSLLIGGFRTTTSLGVTVQVLSNRITVDNAGSPLSGPDVILAANRTLTLAPGSEISQQGALAAPAATLLLGNTTIGSGDGVLLRVSSDVRAAVVRDGLSTSALPALTIGTGVRLTGTAVVVDSTAQASLDSTAVVRGTAVSFSSGRISLALERAGTLQPDAGLVLTGNALQNVQATAQTLSLRSYSSIDLYGTGRVGTGGAGSSLVNLSLSAGEVRGFTSGGDVTFAAQNITLDNRLGALASGAISSGGGSLAFEATTLQLGSVQKRDGTNNRLLITQFDRVRFSASQAVLAAGSGGVNPGLSVQGDFAISTPLLSGRDAAVQTLSASGDFTLAAPSGSTPPLTGAGLAVSLTLEGRNVNASSAILAPSGNVTLHATSGEVVVDGRIDVSGVFRVFNDVTKYTSGGQVELVAEAGSVRLGSNSTINVSAPGGAGDAGSLAVRAPGGSFLASGILLATAGRGGEAGRFSLDLRTIPTLVALSAQLSAGGFTREQIIRVRSGDVVIDGVATARSFALSADTGSITVTGTIDASGTTGGRIGLAAGANLALASTAVLNVAGAQFDAAGKGGAVTLETVGGRIALATGSNIDLSVAGATGGTVHLRAPQLGASEVAIDPFGSRIANASSIVVEGYFRQDTASTTPAAIDPLAATALANATIFMNGADAIQSRLLAGNAGLAGVFHVRPGEEIVNSRGGLVLNSDLDLSTWRFGPRLGVVDAAGNPLRDRAGNPIVSGVEPGVLTLRASGNITLLGSITDGFGTGAGAADGPVDSLGNPAVWKQELLPVFSNGRSQESWAYRLTAGADFSAADFRRTLALSALGTESGSVQLGRNGGLNITFNPGPAALTESLLMGHYQVIRSGTGDIDINAGRDVQLLNPFATIYTAGTRVANPTLGGVFDRPILTPPNGDSFATNVAVFLGAVQETPAYAAQYSERGGNVTVSAQRDVIHLTRDLNGNLVADSQRELPGNWLYRRGYVDPLTGRFGMARFGDLASTTWWIDFSNFFQGIGTLGGGNVALTAGRDVSNVDAVVPTNARAAGRDAQGNALVPTASILAELGGGNLAVRAGRDVDAGIYYVERGTATLSAGNTIHTNATRTPSLGTISGVDTDVFDSRTWLATTLFLGRGSFEVSARGDLLLGPVANPFLLPGGYSNAYWYKTYFSTFGAESAVGVTSLTGAVTLRESVTLPSSGSAPALLAWSRNVQLFSPDILTVSAFQPWLRLNETDVDPFGTTVSLQPPALRVFALSGDINVVGNLTLSAAPRGTIELLAAKALNGLQPGGSTTIGGQTTDGWLSSTINVSDSDPNSLPGVSSPFAYQSVVGVGVASVRTGAGFLTSTDRLFAESGATLGAQSVLQTKQALHSAGLLHANDTEPTRLYAVSGDISGFTFFSPKAARVVAGRDLTDIALYAQNVRADDVSIAAAGRDIVAYDPNSPLRSAATAAGNRLNDGERTLAGDLQVSGPGTLEVFAGRNLDLGVGPNNWDGTALGLTSIGNARNPALGFTGAQIIAGAGIGVAGSLDSSKLDFTAFEAKFLDPESAGAQAQRYLPALGQLLGAAGASNDGVWARYQILAPELRHTLALKIFYLVLRDSGRDRNDPKSPNFRTYTAGFDAIAALFPGHDWNGDISITSREIKTTSGGDIDLFAPGGKLSVGIDASGSQAADQGILTESGGNISIFTNASVSVGTSRIFTLRGGNIAIWSTVGDIAAGASSKTVQSAPPTRVLVDPQSSDVKTDLAGLATGGGIGVLVTVAGVATGDVDLIAPSGTVDAGDAGIRVSGNLNISALQVVNASNISAAGSSTGTPVVTAPNVSGITAASTAAAAATSASTEAARQNANQAPPQELPSIISVDVIGYGGSESSEEEDEEARKKRV